MLVSLTPVTLNRVGFSLPGPRRRWLLAAAGCRRGRAGRGAGGRAGPLLRRRLVLGALGGVVVAGLLRELIRSILGGAGGVEDWAFQL